MKIAVGFFVLILAFFNLLWSQQIITLTDERERYPLGLCLDIFEDQTGQLAIDDIITPQYDSQFRPSRQKVPNFGFTDSAIWVRFKVLNKASTRSPWALELVFPNMHYADLYKLSPQGQVLDVKKTGNSRPVKSRDHEYHHLVFLITVSRQEAQTFYLRFQNQESMTIPLTLWSMTAFMKQSQMNYVMIGAFSGIMLIMIGFNVFLLLSLKDRSYFYYILSIAAILMFALAAKGIALIYLWPKLIGWNHLALPIFAGLMVISLIKFTDVFLLVKKQIPVLHQLINICMLVVGLLIILAPLTSYRFVIRPMVIMGILGAILILVTGLRSMHKGFRPARYFLLSMALIAISGITHLLVRLGIFPSEPIFEQGFSLGNIFFVLLMSLALADRIKLMRKEREKAIQELKESESRFRALVETTYDFIWEIDQKGFYTYVSPKVKALLGYELGDVLGKKIFDFMPAGEAERVSSLFEKKQAAQEPIIGIEIKNIKKNGKVVILETSGVPYFDDRGNILGYRGIDRDITQRKRLEEEGRKLHAQVQHTQKLESLGVLAGGIAHDFNNLLMGVLGNASLALRNLANKTELRRYIGRIEKSAHQAAELTNQLLAYSGKGKFVVQPINLSELVEEMTQLLEVSIPKKVSLRYDLEMTLPLIAADASQISQVIMNLIVNSSEAIGDRNGVVSIGTGLINVDNNYLAGIYLDEKLPEGEYVFLEVSDNGMGMDEQTREKIFDPFFTTKTKGHGLGLAAVLGIVRGHKGVIKVYSEPDRGTTVKVLFPPEKYSAKKLPKKKIKRSAVLAGKTVFVIDDEKTVREVVRDMLENQDMTVITASDGKEGIQLFKQHVGNISLVLLDATMPEMNGEEVFRHLRQIKPDVKVILTSGYNEQDATSHFVGKGLAGFIQKPFSLEKLIEKLSDLAKN